MYVTRIEREKSLGYVSLSHSLNLEKAHSLTLARITTFTFIRCLNIDNVDASFPINTTFARHAYKNIYRNVLKGYY